MRIVGDRELEGASARPRDPDPRDRVTSSGLRDLLYACYFAPGTVPMPPEAAGTKAMVVHTRAAPRQPEGQNAQQQGNRGERGPHAQRLADLVAEAESCAVQAHGQRPNAEDHGRSQNSPSLPAGVPKNRLTHTWSVTGLPRVRLRSLARSRKSPAGPG